MVFLVLGSLGTTDATHDQSAGHFLGLGFQHMCFCKTTVQESRMCKLRTNFQLNHAICLTSRPKPRCFFEISSKITLFFSPRYRTSPSKQWNGTYIYAWHKKWRKKSTPDWPWFRVLRQCTFHRAPNVQSVLLDKREHSVRSSSSTTEQWTPPVHHQNFSEWKSAMLIFR